MSLPADPRARAALLLAAGVAVFVAIIVVVARLTPTPHGPVSSSFATSPRGLAAYAALLERDGLPVRRAVTRVQEHAPARGETLVVLDPDVVEEDEARDHEDDQHEGDDRGGEQECRAGARIGRKVYAASRRSACETTSGQRRREDSRSAGAAGRPP